MSFVNYRNDWTLRQRIDVHLFYDEPRRWQEIMHDADTGLGC